MWPSLGSWYNPIHQASDWSRDEICHLGTRAWIYYATSQSFFFFFNDNGNTNDLSASVSLDPRVYVDLLRDAFVCTGTAGREEDVPL